MTAVDLTESGAMITGTKILVQPPYRDDGLSLCYAEAAGRLAFFLTYFDQVVPLAFNPMMGGGEGLLLSTELEQEYVLSGASKVAQPSRVPISETDRRLFAFMATQALEALNYREGGFAIAPAEGFVAFTDLAPVDRVVLTLKDCLPSPHHETPLAEILAFKREHEGELRAFHTAVEDLYYGFGARPVDTLLPRFKDKLDAHVDAVLRAYEHRQIKSYMGILRIALKLGPPLVGEALGRLAGIPMVGTLLGGAIGLLVDKTKLPTEGNAVPKDFEYVLSGLAAGHARAFPGEPRMEADISGVRFSRSIISTTYPTRVTPPSRGVRDLYIADSAT